MPFQINDPGRSTCGPTGLPSGKTEGRPTLNAGPQGETVDQALRRFEDAGKPIALPVTEDLK